MKTNTFFVVWNGTMYIIAETANLAFGYYNQKRTEAIVFCLKGRLKGSIEVTCLKGNIDARPEYVAEIEELFGDVARGFLGLHLEGSIRWFAEITWSEEKGYHTEPVKKESLAKRLWEICTKKLYVGVSSCMKYVYVGHDSKVVLGFKECPINRDGRKNHAIFELMFTDDGIYTIKIVHEGNKKMPSIKKILDVVEQMLFSDDENLVPVVHQGDEGHHIQDIGSSLLKKNATIAA